MTEPSPAAPNVEPGRGGAGAMLREARLSQGLHIGTLAATMKVPQAKIEALEADRYQELPDVAFTRALAQSICRALKIDSAPILARLPFTDPAALERVDGGLNMPFRERGGRIDPIDWGLWRHPAFWLVVALLAAAGAVAYVPNGWFRDVARLATGGRESPSAADGTVTTALPATLPASALAGAIVERAGTTVATSPVEATPPAATEAASLSAPAAASAADAGASAPAGAASSTETAAAQAVANASTRIRAIETTWVQVTDARGQILLSRLLAAGEAVGLEAEAPLKIRIGNARGTEVVRRGQVVDLAASTRDNIANVELH